MKKARGELLVNVKAALHNMSTMLLFIKPTITKAVKKTKDGNKDVLKEAIMIEDKEDMEERNVLLELEEGEANGKI